jgi:hypothetical protein
VFGLAAKRGPKPDKLERCLERMRAGASLDVIKGEGFSQTTIYSAFEQFGPYMEGRIQTLWDQYAEVDAKLGESRGALKDLDGEASIRREEAGRLETKAKELGNEIDAREDRKGKLSEEIGFLNTKEDELRQRGITTASILRLSRMDVRSDAALLDRLDTAERYKALVLEMSLMQEQVVVLSQRLETLRGDRSQLEEELATLKNQRDELKRENWAIEESLDVVGEYLRRGYDKVTLLGILKALEAYEIEGNPAASVRRLLDALSDFDELVQLENLARQRRVQISILDSKLSDSEGKLAAISDDTLKVLEEAQKRHVEALSQLVAKNDSVLQGVYDQYMSQVTKLGDAEVKRLEDLAMRQSQTLFNDWRVTTEEFKTAFWEFSSQLGILNEELEVINPAMRLALTNIGLMEKVGALLRLKEYPELSKKIEPKLVADVMAGVALWISMEMLNTKSKASESITKMEPGIMANYEYKLLALALFTLEIIVHHADVEASKSQK